MEKIEELFIQWKKNKTKEINIEEGEEVLIIEWVINVIEREEKKEILQLFLFELIELKMKNILKKFPKGYCKIERNML